MKTNLLTHATTGNTHKSVCLVFKLLWCFHLGRYVVVVGGAPSTGNTLKIKIPQAIHAECPGDGLNPETPRQ